MKRNCISEYFTFRNAKDWACNSSPIAQRLHSKLCLSPFGQHRNEYTYRHYFFISLVILKNRTYLSRPSLGIFQRDVHSLIFLSLRQIKPSMSASKCQCCSDWAVSWNLVGSISCTWMSSWDSCWGCSCSAIVDASGAASSVLFVGSARAVYCVAAVWVSFKFVFLFPD